MKKLFLLLLVLAVLIGAVACGAPTETETENGDMTETEQGFETAGTGGDKEPDPFYAAGNPLATVSVNTDKAYARSDNQSIKVVASSASGGVGVLDVLEVYMTPRNVGKLYKITAYVMPIGENAAFRMSVSKQGSDDTAATSHKFNLRANEWNQLTLFYKVSAESTAAGLITVKIDQNVSAAKDAPASQTCGTFYVDDVKASLHKETSSVEYTVFKTEDFEAAKDSFKEYKTSSYAELTDTTKEYKMGSHFEGAKLKVGAKNWQSRSGEKAMVLHELVPNANGSFGARIKLNNLLPNNLRPYIGQTVRISAYVLMEGFQNPDKPVSSQIGLMGDKTTKELVGKVYEINEGEWTLVSFEMEITEEFLGMADLTFDDTSIKEHYPVRPFINFGTHSTNFPKTVFIDDFTVEFAMLNTNIGVKLPSIFADGMVLQRNKRVPVWGWGGKPGDTIVASVDSYTASGVVDANGEFYLELPEMEGGTDKTLIIRNGSAGKTFRNVGIGEVWYCSGQSNMELKMSSVFNVSSIVSQANKYDVRSFKVPVVAKYDLQKDITNGTWKQVTSSNVSGVSAIAYIAAYQLQAELGVPVAIIECYEGGSAAQAWLSYEKLFAADRKFIYDDASILPSVRNNWGCEGRTLWQDYDYYWSRGKIYNTTKSEGTLIDGTKGSKGTRFAPTGLYNAMQGPLANYAIAGVMWYQGESQPNARISKQYNYILYDLIEQWREDFRDEDLPVMLVQLAPYNCENSRSFFEIRQVQIDTAKRLKNIGVISTAYEGTFDDKDVGGTIHPGTKVPVGDRMAATILSMVYGKTGEYCGPLYEYMEIDGNKAILHFSHVADGLKIKDGDTKLTGFKVSADGKNFVDAIATIQRDTVIVSASGVKTPVAVQYAYVNVHPVSGAPDTLGGNLENSISQPAFPFIATLGNANIHDISLVEKNGNGQVQVEIWELGHNQTQYNVKIEVKEQSGVSHPYTVDFKTAGNYVLKSTAAAKSGQTVTVTLSDLKGNIVDIQTVVLK